MAGKLGHALLYDTGARIQELLDLTPRDFHLESPPFVCVRGKGRRERLCPLLPQSARLVRQFLSAAGRQLDDQQPFLQNGRGGRLGRHGARYILLKYLRRATPAMPTLARVGISPHTMRHYLPFLTMSGNGTPTWYFRRMREALPT
jgi:site-specific recombinase XerD